MPVPRREAILQARVQVQSLEPAVEAGPEVVLQAAVPAAVDDAAAELLVRVEEVVAAAHRSTTRTRRTSNWRSIPI